MVVPVESFRKRTQSTGTRVRAMRRETIMEKE